MYAVTTAATQPGARPCCPAGRCPERPLVGWAHASGSGHGVNPDQYDDWLMEQAGQRADRRRRAMVGALVFAMAAMVLIPVIQIFV